MKTLKKLCYVSFVFSMLLCFSCEGEDGMDGLNGEQGEQGIAGQDGQDGNANVTGVTVDPFPSWTEGTYLGQEANFVEIAEPLLTNDVVDDALVLVYFQLNTNIWYPMTYAFPFDNGNEEVITYTYEPQTVTIYALRSTGPLNAGIRKVRYFIIPTNQATNNRTANSVEAKMQSLRDQGIDINNYEEVAAYVGQM